MIQSPHPRMDILLFTHDAGHAAAATAAGIAQVVVDWEWRGKAERQADRNTQISKATVEDLRAVHAAVGERVICRINNTAGERIAERNLAIDNGAAEVWLPMVRSVAEVEQCLVDIDGRARLGIMVETREAMRLGRELSQLPLSRVYVGLHDYCIDTRSSNLFRPIIDGTLDCFRQDYSGAMAVAGVTRPGGGAPIPQRLLLAAMVRLGCTFGVARRAFLADVAAADVSAALDDIAEEVARLAARSDREVAHDHAALTRLIEAGVAPRQRLEASCAR
jgi:hypothetical protein